MIVLYFNHNIHDLLMIFMGMWVIVNWWVWPVPDFHFRKLEAMHFINGNDCFVSPPLAPMANPCHNYFLCT